MPAAKLPSRCVYRAHVAFRSNQELKVRQLAEKRLLSAVCQKAVDEAKIYEEET